MLAVGARLALAPCSTSHASLLGASETGEDPVLNGTLSVAYVRGLPTDACAAIVVAASTSWDTDVGGAQLESVQLGPRELREVYAEPFAAAIRTGLAAIMNS
jgi:beta-glucosidase